MAFDLTFDPENQILILRAVNVTGVGEWQTTVNSLLSHPNASPGTPILFDYRGINYVPDSRDAQQIAAGYLQIYTALHSRMAILIDQGVRFGVARIIEITSGLRGAEMRVFTNRDEAIEWLTGGRGR